MRLIDSDELCKVCKSTGSKCTGNACEVPTMPTVDAVPVVRCKDCAYFGYDKFGDAGCCAPVGLNVPDEDSFCSYGKRRERDTSDEAREMVKTLRWIASNEDFVFNARSATEAADLIERLAEAGESGPAGWISIKDRLPDQELLEHMKRYQENFVEVLVMIKGGQIATALTWDGNSFSDNHIVEYEVTHWMPLPEPPGNSDAQA